ncbi:hypothetical protein H7D82_000764 [Salmonella enterica]|nr:hypothetical protein [Salmonella enterica]EKB7612263.1 hypothetical protein [Salmonella enterica]
MFRIKRKKVFIYSPCCITKVAIRFLCLNGAKHEIITEDIQDINVLFSRIKGGKVDYVVLDVNPARFLYDLYCLRITFPNLPVIFTQERFHFVDSIISRFFGGVWLKEYDAILAGWPRINLMEHVSNEIFSGADMNCCFYTFMGKEIVSKQVFFECLREWIDSRLAGVILSKREREVYFDIAISGLEVRGIALKLKVSNQVVYSCRRSIINVIGADSCRKKKLNFMSVIN